MRASMWWIDRWRASDGYARMTAEEQGLYRNLCDEVFLRDSGVIPDDQRILAKASGDHEAWARSGKSVLKSMKKVAGGWTNETALEVKKESERRAKKQRAYRNGSGNDTGNASGNEAHEDAGNESRPPEKEMEQGKNPSLETTPVQPPSSPSVDSRSDADAARADLRKDLQALRVREHAFSEKTDQEILDRPVFHSTSGGIVRIDTCSSAGLMRATSEKVRAYGQPKPGKARKANGAPAWDRGVDHDVPDEVILAWDPRLGPKPEALRDPAQTRQTQTQEMPQ